MDSSDSETEQSLLAKIQSLTARLAKKQQKRLRNSYKSPKHTTIPESPQCPRTPPRKIISSPSHSPTRSRNHTPGSTPTSASKVPVSPARILLGVDKGLKAKDVSLKRPKSHDQTPSILLTEKVEDGSKMKIGVTSVGLANNDTISSFADKLDSLKAKKKESIEAAEKEAELLKNRQQSFKTPFRDYSNEKNESLCNDTAKTEDKYSKLKLLNRYIDADELDEELSCKEVITIPRLFAEVSPPDFKSPSYENYVVVGAVGRKSEVRENKLKSKYMILTLTDLKYDIPFAIHGDAFERYWKIQEGTVIAVLNPSIYLTGEKFTDGVLAKSIGLSVAKGYDLIIEVGQAADIGKCQATTGKGVRCSNWINIRKATYCDFHVEQGIKRTGSGRMEFNSTSTKVFSPQISGQINKFNQGGSRRSFSSKLNTGLGIDPYGATTTDLQDGNTGKIYSSAASIAFFDDSYEQPLRANDTATYKKRKALEHEQMIRKKLSQRPNGVLLREYDGKGNLKDQISNSNMIEASYSTTRTFTPQQIRQIGFDPTRKPADGISKDVGVTRDASQVSLSKPPAHSDELDDELEII